MSELVPPKAPSRLRGGKTPPRETTSSLLMSVIRTLSTSESNEQRELEKRRLEKEYKKSDVRLDTLLDANGHQLKEAMQIFNVVSSRLSESREKLHIIKENLTTCKRLLHCKRDELKERWLEGIEHKHVLQLLQQIEEVQDVGDRVGALVAKRQYLKATKLLTEALQKLHTDLKRVEALKEVHTDLNIRKEKLYTTLLEDLHRHLYQKWTSEVLALKRQGSGRDSFNALCKTDRPKIDRSRQTMVDLINQLKKPKSRDDGELEDLNGPDPEADSGHFMAVVVECFGKLQKLPEAFESIKGRMQKEMTFIVEVTTRQLIDNSAPMGNADEGGEEGDQTPSPQNLIGGEAKLCCKAETRESKMLQELIQTVFEQLRVVAAAHDCFLSSVANFQRRQMLQNNQIQHGTTLGYTSQDVWAKVQATLQMILSEYLNLSDLGSTPQQTSATYTEANADISSYFGKKKNNLAKPFSSFRFDASYHAITMNSYLTDKRSDHTDTSGSAPPCPSVCPPSPHNVTCVFSLTHALSRDIEQASDVPTGSHCSLWLFVTDYVRDVYLALVHVENARRLETATRTLEEGRTVAKGGALKAMNANKPILQSTASVWEGICDLRGLVAALPAFTEHLIGMVCQTLLNYRDTCSSCYKSVTQPLGQQHNQQTNHFISANWAKDPDINRCLKNLPNWRALQEGGPRGALKSQISVDEHPEEISDRNRREAEILTGNLGDQVISESEVIFDQKQLRTLAHMHESLEWFGGCVIKLASSLPSRSVMLKKDVPVVSEATVQTLTSLGKDFEELAQKCLLVLHLEVRLHCFFHLQPLWGGHRIGGSEVGTGFDPQEADPEVLRLNKDLAAMDEILTDTLQQRKCKYIFEGVGSLIANLVMCRVTQLRRVTAPVVKKMCRNIFCIQQQLTNITMMRQLELDSARQYYELLYLTPEDLLNHIVNAGKQYSELEYSNILSLLYKSQMSTLGHNTLKMYEHRLSEILGDKSGH